MIMIGDIDFEQYKEYKEYSEKEILKLTGIPKDLYEKRKKN